MLGDGWRWGNRFSSNAGCGFFWVTCVPWAAVVSCVMRWWRSALDVPLAQVGHGHVSSIGPKSRACRLSPAASSATNGVPIKKKVRRTQIQRTVEGECHSEAGSPRGEYAVRLDSFDECVRYSRERGRTMSIPRATHTSRSKKPLRSKFDRTRDTHPQQSQYPLRSEVLVSISVTWPLRG